MADPEKRGRVSRILIVDDHDLVRGFTRTALEQVGYTVDTAANGAEALEKIGDTSPYDLLITDINMPELDGFQVLDRLRDVRSMRKIIYSATAEDADIRRSLNEMNLMSDVDALIGKPCPITEFLSMIDQILTQS